MKVEVEPDKVDARFVGGVAAASVGITLLCCLIAWLLLRYDARENRREQAHELRVQQPQSELNDVEADVLTRKPLDTVRTRAGKRLRSYGWSDRRQQRVHLPIQRAFELYLQGVRVAGPGAGGAAP